MEVIKLLINHFLTACFDLTSRFCPVDGWQRAWLEKLKKYWRLLMDELINLMFKGDWATLWALVKFRKFIYWFFTEKTVTIFFFQTLLFRFGVGSLEEQQTSQSWLWFLYFERSGEVIFFFPDYRERVGTAFHPSSGSSRHVFIVFDFKVFRVNR